MRRSAAVTLTLLAGAGLGLAFCHNDSDTDGVVETEEACVGRLGSDTASECADVFQSARTTHAATAPQFGSAEACRTATGADCVPFASGSGPDRAPSASSAGSVFIPVMAGVMIGRLLSDGTRGATPVYAGPVPPACLPGGPGGIGCPVSPTSTAPSSGTSSSTGGTGGASGGRRFWYSGSSYAGFSDGGGRAGFRGASTSTEGDGLLSRSTRSGSPSAFQSGSASSRSGASASRSGGFGSSSAAHAGGGS